MHEYTIMPRGRSLSLVSPRNELYKDDHHDEVDGHPDKTRAATRMHGPASCQANMLKVTHTMHNLLSAPAGIGLRMCYHDSARVRRQLWSL